MQKLFDKYMDKIRTSTLGERDIIALRSALNSGKFNDKIADEYQPHRFVFIPMYKVIIAAIKLSQPIIEAEQSAKGLDWLKKQWRTPTGATRKRNPFSPRETHVIENFASFRLVNLKDQADGFRWAAGLRDYKPVYRVIASDGRYFDYVSGPGTAPRITASGSAHLKVVAL